MKGVGDLYNINENWMLSTLKERSNHVNKPHEKYKPLFNFTCFINNKSNKCWKCLMYEYATMFSIYHKNIWTDGETNQINIKFQKTLKKIQYI